VLPGRAEFVVLSDRHFVPTVVIAKIIRRQVDRMCQESVISGQPQLHSPDAPRIITYLKAV
jgi:hypothetical protein